MVNLIGVNSCVAKCRSIKKHRLTVGQARCCFFASLTCLLVIASYFKPKVVQKQLVCVVQNLTFCCKF